MSDYSVLRRCHNSIHLSDQQHTATDPRPSRRRFTQCDPERKAMAGILHLLANPVLGTCEILFWILHYACKFKIDWYWCLQITCKWKCIIPRLYSMATVRGTGGVQAPCVQGQAEPESLSGRRQMKEERERRGTATGSSHGQGQPAFLERGPDGSRVIFLWARVIFCA